MKAAVKILHRRHRPAPFRSAWKLFSNRYFFLVAVFLASDYLLYARLSRLLVEDEELRPDQFKRVTIKQLIANVSTPLDLLTQIPNRRDSDPDEQHAFKYQSITCGNLVRVAGERSIFRICYPPRFNESGRLAYLINGPRDNPFERSLKSMLHTGTALKVFTSHDTSIKYEFEPDLVEDVDVEIYVEQGKDSKQVGIKDLIDLHDDYHMMEFIKYEMDNVTDPIVFSINIPIFASHLLLRLDNFSYEEFRYLIKRLAYSLYFPYSVVHDHHRGIHFMALMHKYSMNKYNITREGSTTWTRKEHGKRRE